MIDKSDIEKIEKLENELYRDYSAADMDVNSCYKLGDEIYVVSSLGSCPVEYCGVVDSFCFFFKSRGESWHFTIADTKDNSLSFAHVKEDINVQFSCSGRYSDQVAKAGYMPIEQAENIIRSCVLLWRSGQLIDQQ